MDGEFGREMFIFVFSWAVIMTGLVVILVATRPTTQPPVIIASPPAQPADAGCGLILILPVAVIIALALFAMLVSPQ